MAIDKNAPGLNIQDALRDVQARSGELIKLDAGFMLPPVSHNSLESAAKLYGPDYFVNTFRRNVTSNADPFGSSGQSPVGRDAGAQLRAARCSTATSTSASACSRDTGSARFRRPTRIRPWSADVNMFRVAGRLQINLLDAEPGFFYQGTYLGAKKIVSLGGFYDFQDTTTSILAATSSSTCPSAPGSSPRRATSCSGTAGPSSRSPSSRAYMGELGYLIGPIRLSPIAHFERLVSY